MNYKATKCTKKSDELSNLIIGSAIEVHLHEAQLLTYLNLSDLWLGLLINFNVPVLKDGIRRIVN